MMTNSSHQKNRCSFIAALIALAMCIFIPVGQTNPWAQASAQTAHEEPVPEQFQPDSETLHPVWVIVVFETKNDKIVGVTEFVFATYDACTKSAEQARDELGLHLMPVCYLRWLKALPGAPA